MALKKCKECGKEISSSVNQCPSCGKKQKNWFARHPFMTGFLGLIILIIIISNTGDKKDDGVTKVGSSNSTSQAQTINVGDAFRTDKFEITVTKVEERAKVGSQYLEKKPAEGGTFYTIQYKYKNITDKPTSSFDNPTLKLIDPNGTELSDDLGASSYFATELNLDSKSFTELNPGITVTDASVFEINKETFAKTGWILKIKADKEARVNLK
jgi:hypothetical protein